MLFTFLADKEPNEAQTTTRHSHEEPWKFNRCYLFFLQTRRPWGTDSHEAQATYEPQGADKGFARHKDAQGADEAQGCFEDRGGERAHGA